MIGGGVKDIEHSGIPGEFIWGDEIQLSRVTCQPGGA